jgi:hypothetical protein
VVDVKGPPNERPKPKSRIKINTHDQVHEALSFLVRLKDHKQEHGKDEFYRTNQPVAWERAREALKSHYKAKTTYQRLNDIKEILDKTNG